MLIRQFRLLAVLLYLEGYILESDTACLLPEKCCILLNAPDLSVSLLNRAAPERYCLTSPGEYSRESADAGTGIAGSPLKGLIHQIRMNIYRH